MTQAIRAASPTTGAHYRPSHLRHVETVEIRGWRMKVYGIALQGRTCGPALLAASLAWAEAALPARDPADPFSGYDFVVAHDAAVLDIALVYWWESENELHQRGFAGAKPDGWQSDGSTLAPIPYQAAGCVWEIGVIDFERRAWLADVLANPAGPDIDLYLGRKLAADV